MDLLNKIELYCAPDGCPAVVDSQFDKYILGVGAEGVNRHAQLLSNFWST